MAYQGPRIHFVAPDPRRIRYVAPDGDMIYLVVGWPKWIGRIPPPEITFYDSEAKAAMTYVYAPER